MPKAFNPGSIPPVELGLSQIEAGLQPRPGPSTPPRAAAMEASSRSLRES